jgi:penicillin-binding protein 1C
MPAHEAPGLAIGLGGLGITLKDLTQLYAALANRGKPVRLGNGVSEAPAVLQNQEIIEPVAAWNVTDILAGVQPPKGASRRTIAYKTGTSYGYRDAWSVGYDGRYVLGVWIGRPDNGAVPGITGFGTAAPVLFEAFARSGVPVTAFPSAPAGAARLAQSDLPISQRRFSMTESGLLRNNVVEAAPQIIYPPEGARIALSGSDDGPREALALKLQGGKAPFRWLANGRPLAELSRRRISQWVPDGNGFSTLTVIDAAGRAATVGVYIN